MIFAQKLDLPIKPSQEEREKEILNAKYNKLSIDGVQIPHPNNIKENWITGSEYLPSIVLKTIDEYAELNLVKKAPKEGRNLVFSGHVMSVKFNPINSSLKYCFVKGVVVVVVVVLFVFYNMKIYKHEIQEKLNKKHIKIQGFNIHYKSNAYNEAAQ